MNPLAIPLLSCLALNPPPGGSGPQPPLPPILKALDADQDGVISAAEIVNAPSALRRLDTNKDGRLTPDEYRPPRPDEPAPRPEGPGPGGPPKAEDPGRKPPRPPVDLALDANGDEIISADEIARAAALLKALDTNGDGKLSREECLPKPPGGKGAPGGTPPQAHP